MWLTLVFLLSTAEPIEYERQVAPIFTQLGCNSGACHGAPHGKGGFKLSLFSENLDKDYEAIRAEGDDRLDLQEPGQSLLLRKPTRQLPHKGGKRLDPSSWQYDVLLSWIKAGAKRSPGAGIVRSLSFGHSEVFFDAIGREQKIMVTAQFASGAHADVTRYCELRVLDEAIAKVNDGVISAQGVGESALIANYNGAHASVPVLVAVHPAKAGRYVHLIDRHILGQLDRLGVKYAQPTDDATFLRRVYLDVVGDLPATSEVRLFLANQTSNKRGLLVAGLLKHERHADLWATRWSDILGASSTSLPEGRINQWHGWLKQRFERNQPLSELASDILTADSREGKSVELWLDEEINRVRETRAGRPVIYDKRSTLDLAWQRRDATGGPLPVTKVTEQMATAFLGVRIECAQCHRHPFDRWTQADYRAFANIFAPVQVGLSVDAVRTLSNRLEARRQGKLKEPTIPQVTEVFWDPAAAQMWTDPVTGALLAPRPLGAEPLSQAGDSRKFFVQWLLAVDNPFFAKSMVNRVWAHYFGSGLVDPVDAFSSSNPATHPKLLDELAREFISHKFDLRWLETEILTSAVYGLSAEPIDATNSERVRYARFQPRVMLAEVFVDSLGAALQEQTRRRVLETPNRNQLERHEQELLALFGAPDRTTICDCGRPKAPNLRMVMSLMSDPTIVERVDRAARRWAKQLANDTELVEHVYLATLSRKPTDAERKAALEHSTLTTNRVQGLADIVWSLINSEEFRFVH